MDVGAQCLQWRDIHDSELRRRVATHSPRVGSSIAVRNAASVLPDPVGAAMSVCRPERIFNRGAAQKWAHRAIRGTSVRRADGNQESAMRTCRGVFPNDISSTDLTCDGGIY